MFKWLLLLILPVTLFAQAFVQQTGKQLTMGNNYFTFVFEKQGQKLKLAQINNRLSQNRYSIDGDLFQITATYLGEDITPPRQTPKHWGVQDFKFTGWYSSDSLDGKKINLQFEGHGLQVNVHLFIPDQKPWIKFKLEIRDAWQAGTFIEQVDVLRLHINGLQAQHGGFGQPVFAKDLFLGIEFPAAYSQTENHNIVRSWHYVAQKLPTKGSYFSHWAVLGFSKFNAVQQTFFQYIRQLRPRLDQPFVLYNTWYDIRNFSYAKLLATIHDFEQTLIKRYQLHLDAFVIDDGWDNVHSLWEIDSSKFAQGFEPLRRALNKFGSHLGLWISPWNGYGKARNQRVQWAAEHGYKTSGSHLCLGDDVYFNLFKKKTLQYLQEADLSFYKIDGFLSVCNETNHNHLPGIYSRHALTARFVEILKALRQANPNIFIDITVGTWLSPWWLQYADAVWMTGADYGHAEGVPAFSERDKAITFRDFTLYKDFVKQQFQFPLSNVMTHGIIKGKLNLLGGKDETLRDWMNNVVMYFARGVMMWELYISPEILSRQEWDFLAATMKWAYQNQEVLKNTSFLGGNPYQKQIYAYLHWTKDKYLLILRNPFVKPQTVSFTYHQLFGQMEQRSFVAQNLFPQHYFHASIVHPDSDFSVTLQGYEVRVIHFEPVQLQNAPFLTNVVLKTVQQSSKSITYDLFTDGSNVSAIELKNPRQIKRLTFNSQSIKLKDFKQQLQQWSIPEAHKQKFTFNFDSFNKEKIAATIDFKNHINTFSGRVGFLLEFSKAVDTLNVEIRSNGSSLAPLIKKGARGAWYWIMLPITAFNNPIKFEFTPIKQKHFPEFQFSIWQVGTQKLTRIGRLKIDTRSPLFKKRYAIPTEAGQQWRTRLLFSGHIE